MSSGRLQHCARQSAPIPPSTDRSTSSRTSCSGASRRSENKCIPLGSRRDCSMSPATAGWPHAPAKVATQRGEHMPTDFIQLERPPPGRCLNRLRRTLLEPYIPLEPAPPPHCGTSSRAGSVGSRPPTVPFAGPASKRHATDRGQDFAPERPPGPPAPGAPRSRCSPRACRSRLALAEPYPRPRPDPARGQRLGGSLR